MFRQAEESDTRIARLEDKMEILLNKMQFFMGSQGASGSLDQRPATNTLERRQRFIMYFLCEHYSKHRHSSEFV